MGYTGTRGKEDGERAGRSLPRRFYPRESSAHQRLSDAVSCTAAEKCPLFAD